MSRRQPFTDEQLDDPAIQAEVERLLAGRIRHIRLSPALGRLFRQFTANSRGRVARDWFTWVAFLNVACLGIDYLMSPNSLLFSAAMRILVLNPILLAGYWVWRKPRAEWLEGISIPLATAGVALVTGMIGAQVDALLTERYLTNGLFVALSALVILSLPPRWMVATTVAPLVAGVGFAVFLSDVDVKMLTFLGVFYSVGFWAVCTARLNAWQVQQHGFLLTFRDAYTQRKLLSANAELDTLARTDALTGLPNRRAFETDIEPVWRNAGAAGRRLGVLMVDVDHFKRLNDHAGHAEGDRCLKAVADALRGTVRDGADLVARLGGEEFVIVTTGAATEADVGIIGERLRAAIEDLALPNPGSPIQGRVTASVGCTLADPGQDTDIRRAISRADRALYLAKSFGRNTVCGSEPPAHDPTVMRLRRG